MADDPQHALLERIQNGDERAFGALAQQLSPPLYALALRMLNNTEHAEDVVQDVLIKIWQHAPLHDPKQAKLSTWAYRVTINRCHDLLRQQRPTDETYDVESLASTAPTGDEIIAEKEQRAHMIAALDTLPPTQRAAVVLTYYHHVSNKEAAQILQTSVKSVESLLVRGRKALRLALSSPLRKAS